MSFRRVIFVSEHLEVEVEHSNGQGRWCDYRYLPMYYTEIKMERNFRTDRHPWDDQPATDWP